MIPARALPAVALLLALGGCTGDDGPPPEPSVTAVVRDAAPASAAEVRERGAPVTSGDVTLAVWAPWGAVQGPPPGDAAAAEQDGAVTLSVSVPGMSGAPGLEVARVAAPEGMTLDPLGDGTAVVRDAGGQVVAALTAPVAPPGTSGIDVRVDGTADGTLTWTVGVPVRTDGSVPTASTEATTLTATVAASALRSATWSDRDDEGGRSLAVVPAAWARSGGRAAEEALVSQLVAREPEAGAPGMRDQLTCHLIGAPDKASWNLEPWRPEVGLLATIGALCNPE